MKQVITFKNGMLFLIKAEPLCESEIDNDIFIMKITHVNDFSIKIRCLCSSHSSRLHVGYSTNIDVENAQKLFSDNYYIEL